MNRILLIGIFFLFCFTLMSAQENTPANVPKATSIQLRPNSKDVAPVRRTNLHERMEVRKRAAMLHQQHLNSLRRNKTINHARPASRENLSTQQRLVRQRMLRQKAIQQRRQRMRMR